MNDDNNLLLIGVCGGSASGKSSISKYIHNYFGQKKCGIIEVDSYYNDLRHIDFEEREKKNFDHPNAFDFNFLYEQLIALKNNSSIEIPIYDYKTHTRKNDFKKISNQKIIVIEGILTFHDKRVRDILDMKIFVDTSEKVRMERRIKRDMRSRNRTYESIIHQFKSTVTPMHNKFIQPTKKYADLIIKEISKSDEGYIKLLEIISTLIR